MENYPVGSLTQAMVAAHLNGPEDPYQVAAKTIRETVRVALRNLPAWDPAADLAVEEAVRGGMQALIKADLDVARGGYLTLCELSDLAHDCGRDPKDTVTSAMRGMASIKRLIRPEQLERLRQAIEAGYEGSGSTFGLMLRTVSPAPAAWQTQFD